jgi:translation elongation factor EF-Tu-like GTPase
MGTVAWYMHVGTLINVHYDMVNENDLLERLQINFKSITSTLEWEGLETPMRLCDAILEDI